MPNMLLYNGPNYRWASVTICYQARYNELWSLKVTLRQGIEFKYIYKQLKDEAKTLLKHSELEFLKESLNLTEKTTRKLECRNLYSAIERRDLDLSFEAEKLNSSIKDLWKLICQHRVQNLQQAEAIHIQDTLQNLKQRYTNTFDLLDRQQELLWEQIEFSQYYILQGEQLKLGSNQQIKEVDEELEVDGINNNGNRIEQLRSEIEANSDQIEKLNKGKGKWFQTDHDYFVRMYNKYRGNDTKIIQESSRILGMNKIQVIDHLSLYDRYLQLESEKKLIANQYRKIRMHEKEQMAQQQNQKSKRAQQKQSKKKSVIEEQQRRKKKAIKAYHINKLQQIQFQTISQSPLQKKATKVKNILQQDKPSIIEINKERIKKQQQKFKAKNSSKPKTKNK